MALVTDTPEVLSGTGVTLRAVWFDPAGGSGRFLWRLCPEAPDGDARACARPEGGVSRAVSDRAELDLSSSEISLRPTEQSATWVVYLALCPGTDPVYSPSLGHARCEGSAAVQAVRRVTVRRAPPLNHNPGIGRVTLRTSSLSVDLSDETRAGCPQGCTVSLDPSAGAAEAGETLMASFYATAGSFDSPRVLGPVGTEPRLSTLWRPVGVSTGSVVRMWIVLRDQRGGESVRQGMVTVP